MRDAANEWLDAIDRNSPYHVPPSIRQAWQTVRRSGSDGIREIPLVSDLFLALVKIVAISDEVFSLFSQSGVITRRAFEISHDFLMVNPRSGGSSTLCSCIDSSRLRVLPKSRLITKGMNVRSLTHFLALCPGGETTVQWYEVSSCKAPEGDQINLLLVPWPYLMSAKQFSRLDPQHRTGHELAPGFDYFS